MKSVPLGAVFTTMIQLQFDFNSTFIRLLFDSVDIRLLAKGHKGHCDVTR